MAFEDRIKASIAFQVGSGTATTVPGGNIKNLSIHLRAWGFEAELDFWIVSQQSQSEDTLFSTFVVTDALTATLTVDRAFDEVGLTASPLTLKGLVTERSVMERAFADVDGNPVLQRHYRVRFADRASVLWAQHYPVSLYVDQMLKDVFEAHKPDGVTLAYSWTSATTTQRPIQALGLGVDGGRASFLDFVHWICDRENAGLFYDVGADSYTFRDAKSSLGTATEIPAEDIAQVDVHFPELNRYAGSVLNSHVGASTAKKDVTNAQAVTGVRRDFLQTSAIESDITDRATLEGKRLASRSHEIVLTYGRYPGVAMVTHGLYKFGDDWSSNAYPSANTYRCHALDLHARALSQDPVDQLDEDSNRYRFDLSARLELSSDTVFHRPPYQAPSWPFHLEGTIVSETGSDDEKTYQIYTDSTTSVDQYKVKIPLFDKTVVVPYSPNLVPGHFYFPADKGDRVLVTFEFRRGFIKRFLDWHAGAKLPKETQGDHLLFGKKSTSQTSIQHAYEDAKPVLKIERTSDTDVQTIKISEGKVLIEAKENQGGGGGGGAGGGAAA